MCVFKIDTQRTT